MNEFTDPDENAPQELSSEEMATLTGGTGFRYELAASTGTNHNL